MSKRHSRLDDDQANVEDPLPIYVGSVHSIQHANTKFPPDKDSICIVANTAVLARLLVGLVVVQFSILSE